MYLAAAVMLACALHPASSGTPDPVPAPPATQGYHVRALEERARDWIRVGAARSRTFQELLGRLTASDVIVYVEIVDRIESGAHGRTMFVTSTETARYVRVQLNGAGSDAEMIALLGHELQHAVEIAGAPRVRDSGAVATLYLHPGDPAAPYDSLDARVAGDRVRDELAAGYRTARRRATVGQ